MLIHRPQHSSPKSLALLALPKTDVKLKRKEQYAEGGGQLRVRRLIVTLAICDS